MGSQLFFSIFLLINTFFIIGCFSAVIHCMLWFQIFSKYDIPITSEFLKQIKMKKYTLIKLDDKKYIIVSSRFFPEVCWYDDNISEDDAIKFFKDFKITRKKSAIIIKQKDIKLSKNNMDDED